MQSVVIIIHLAVVVAMIGFVLLQRSEGGGLGIGSGGGVMTNRGTANVLTRSTAILAAVFFATSLVLSILASLDRKPRSIMNQPGQTQPAPPTPQPQAPLGGPGGGVLDRLGGPPATAPAQSAPPAPATPPAGAPPSSQ